MIDFQQKNKLRNIAYSPTVMVVVVLIALYAIYSTFVMYTKLVRSRNDVNTAQASLLVLSQKNRQLDQNISALQTEQGTEKEIRQKFGVAKSDESVAVIVEDDSSIVTPSVKTSFWQKMEQFFGL